MKNRVLVSVAVLFKNKGKRQRWFLIKNKEEDEWELPKVIVRKVESSVRAALRMMGEKGGMSTKVLEEAGRAGGVTTVNGKVVPQRHLYYLMILRSTEGEAIGFDEHAWLPFAKATRRLSSKREKQMLRQAKKEYTKWRKKQKELQEQAS